MTIGQADSAKLASIERSVANRRFIDDAKLEARGRTRRRPAAEKHDPTCGKDAGLRQWACAHEF